VSCENGSAAECLLRQLGELPVSPETLIIAGVGLAAVGAVMIWAGRPQAGRRLDRTGRTTGASGALTCAAVSAGVITGVEWAVVSQTDRAWVSMIVLVLPAFLAGATVARLLTVVRTIHAQRRQSRNISAGWGRSGD
jgi:hypothetical protein